MSKELQIFGIAVGSRRYFAIQNGSELIGEISKDLESHAYCEMVNDLAKKACAAIDRIYSDLTKASRALRHIPKQNREKLQKVILALGGLAKYGGKHNSKMTDCKALLSLSNASTNSFSGAQEKDIQQAVQMVKTGGKTALGVRSNRVDTLRKAVTEPRSAGNDPKKAAFLAELTQGQKKPEFLKDVLLAFDVSETPDKFFPPGRPIGSDRYIAFAESMVFIKPDKISMTRNSKDYADTLKSSLQNIARKIGLDVERGLRDNDYIKDDTAIALKQAFAQLKKCDVSYFGVEEKIARLAWFVGGNPNQIKELQRKLNALGIRGTSGKLLDDGVYGKKTLSSWNSFFNRFVDGTVPTLNWIDPLQSNLTGIRSVPIDTNLGRISSLRDYSSRSLNPKGTTVLRADYDARNLYHINTVEGKAIKSGQYNPSKLQKWFLGKFNHRQLSEGAYNVLKDFDGAAKKVRVGGKVFLVGGIALDALELGMTIDADLKDADKKLGKKTVSTSARIGGRWAGAIGGAKVGAMAGAAAGSVFPGVGTAIGITVGGLVLGVAGAFAGDKVAEWVVDITCAEE